MNQNPYQAPIADPTEPVQSTHWRRIVDFRAILIKWEKYRLIYNAVLIATTILSLFAFSAGSVGIEEFAVMFLGAILANVLYMLGPSLDGYLQVAGLRHRVFGLFILGCGTLCAVVLAALTVAALGNALLL